MRISDLFQPDDDHRSAVCGKGAVNLIAPRLRIPYPRVLFLAGQCYREFLMPALEADGIIVEAPMAHLTQGRQLEWLGTQ